MALRPAFTISTAWPPVRAPSAGDVRLGVQQLPEALGAAARASVCSTRTEPRSRTTWSARVVARDARPPVGSPIRLAAQRFRACMRSVLLVVAVRLHRGAAPFSRSAPARGWSGTPRTRRDSATRSNSARASGMRAASKSSPRASRRRSVSSSRMAAARSRRHLAAVVQADAVADPLPDLRPRDLGGGGVLHQVVDGGGAGPREPRRDVADADVHVGADAGLGDGAARSTPRPAGRAAVAARRPRARPRAGSGARRAPRRRSRSPPAPGRGARPRCRRSRRRPRAPCPRGPSPARARSPRGRGGWG